jgi:AraC-like DNA-binding protein
LLVLPISMVVALILGFLLVRALVRRDRRPALAVLIGACAVQALVVSLAQHYELAPFQHFQPVTAAAIPPLAFATFQATALRPLDPRRDWPHALPTVLAVVCAALAPAALDLVIPALFGGYGAAILLKSRSADRLPLTRLEAGSRPALVWRVMALALIVSGLSDGVIALAQAAGLGRWQPWIIAVFSAASLLLLGALSLSQSLSQPDLPSPLPDPMAPEEPPPNHPTEADAEVMARLGQLLAERKLYLDPDLTLSQLARRLRLPAKALSGAINRSTGGNVSRHVNALRIEDACRRLAAGESVTSAMLHSGFNTKSNFNREFARVTGQTPSEWRKRAP